MKIQLTIILASTSLFLAAKAQTTYNYSGVLNLSSGITQNIPANAEYQGSPAYEAFESFDLPSAGAGFTLNPGDTFEGEITFANNQQILWQNQGASEGYLDLQFNAPQGYTFLESSVTLLGVNGTSGQSSPYVQSTEGFLGAEYFASPNSVISFTGFSYAATVSETASSSGPWTPYVFGITSGPNGITIQSVPETTNAIALMATAVSALLFTGRRRKIS